MSETNKTQSPNPGNGNVDDDGANTDADIAADIRAAADGEALPSEEAEAATSQALREELDAVKEQLLRTAADLENTRRRAEREKADAGRYAIANFARDLLSVADNFERALEYAPEEPTAVTTDELKGLINGIKMTNTELQLVFDRNGVKKIEPKGEKFDPNKHQAVAQAPSDAPSGMVADVAQSGFMIGDRVLRAAMVVVSTGPAPGTGSASAAPSDDPSGSYNAGVSDDDQSALDKKV
ncbi:MAG: nucleotide exchange factor GrpE [Pseudomonadota bacterium]